MPPSSPASRGRRVPCISLRYRAHAHDSLEAIVGTGYVTSACVEAYSGRGANRR